MRWPLRYQILVPLALLLMVAICAISAVNALLATARAKAHIEEQLQSIAGTLSDTSFPLTEVVLRQMHGLSGAEFVYTDLAGKTLASSGAIELPPKRDDAEYSSVVAETWQELHLGAPKPIGDQRYFAMELAVRGRGMGPPGRLHILYPERYWKEARSEAALPPLVIGAVFLAATAALSLLIAKRLTKPILELRSQVNRIAEADYSPMPLPARDDELRDLGGAVNRLAAQLSEMERAIRRSERLSLLGQLAGGLAHHLRNNVTGAQMAVQLHARECGTDRESLDVALRQLALTEENLKQFLAAPQATPGGMPLNIVPCALGAIVQEVVDLVGPSLVHRKVQLSVIEQGTGPDEFRADTSQLRQMMMNLVFNAADAAGPGGRIRIEVERDVFRVIDNGPGPAAEFVGKLFEPFATTKPEGIGLGLSVAQQIAQSHGGRVVFQRIGGETCFEVDLSNEESRRQKVKGKMEEAEIAESK